MGRLARSQVRFRPARTLALIAGPVADRASSHLRKGSE
jgi:hypothetical protein